MMASLLLCEVRGSWLVKQYLTIQKQMDLTESRGASLGQTKHKQEGGGLNTSSVRREMRQVCLFVHAETDSEVPL